MILCKKNFSDQTDVMMRLLEPKPYEGFTHGEMEET